MQIERQIKVEVLDPGTFGENGIELKIARLDKINPVVSGNKIFKLHYFLEEFKSSGLNSIATFGGAYSNHLVATAFAAHALAVPSIGFVRGDEVLNDTLNECQGYGMKLVFLGRSNYSEIANEPSLLSEIYPGSYFIPEGGYHPLGAKGASLILDELSGEHYTDICTAVGTATTLAGLVRDQSKKVHAVPVLKGMNDLRARLQYLNGKTSSNLNIWDEYHFGGYARPTKQLFEFMNWLYKEFHLETDFVYTAKMMFGVIDKIKKGYFPLGSSVMCLHTGGLQGNRSLDKDVLDF